MCKCWRRRNPDEPPPDEPDRNDAIDWAEVILLIIEVFTFIFFIISFLSLWWTPIPYILFGLLLILLLVSFILYFVGSYNYPYRKQWKSLNQSDVALITGGSNGLGLEIAKSLLMRNVTVFVIDKTPPPEKVEKDSNFNYIECDLGDEMDLKVKLSTLIHSLNEENKYISIVINNAGIRDNKSLVNLRFDKVKSLFNVNTIAQVFILQKIVSNHLSYNVNGKLSIVTVSSILGTFAPKNLSVYSATKAAQIMLHESLQQELKQFPKIRLMLVTTGQMNTELFKDVSAPKQYIAPVVNHVDLAKEITNKIDKGYMGNLSRPFYANFLPGVRTTPLIVQDFCRWFSEIDDQIKETKDFQF
ncbi:hypothetical protein KGF54_001790 [Candida jiufengensis]|uniref:uncharacterized protein n=1 Tax=Candida jiufengensis TaxID=497108 RepID=UPI00222511DE|nr:uncharacterized protein KGF54_001790 [Candida jiufengensis]KAI5955229.1 hypothetical protein KGF54_001790 [Candida jiufengensis]